MLNNLFAYLTVALTDVKEREEGQGLVEYALIIALVSVVLIAALGLLAGDIREVFGRIGAALDAA